MNKDQVEFYAEIRLETDSAVLTWDGVDEIWLPKSQIEINKIKPPDVKIILPEWLAKDKGII